MSTLSGAEEVAGGRVAFAVEVCAPLDELGYADGALGDERFSSGTVDESITGVDGVFKVKGDVLVAFHSHGDSALRVVGVGFA